MKSLTINPRLSGRGVPLSERKLLLVGSVYVTILDKDQFPSNKDLHGYVSLFEELFHIVDKKTGDKGYRPYLYKDRTLLASRIARRISETDSAELLYELIAQHIAFVQSQNTDTKKVTHKKRATTTLLEDFNRTEDN